MNEKKTIRLEPLEVEQMRSASLAVSLAESRLTLARQALSALQDRLGAKYPGIGGVDLDRGVGMLSGDPTPPPHMPPRSNGNQGNGKNKLPKVARG